jgi:hypothetical protein
MSHSYLAGRFQAINSQRHEHPEAYAIFGAGSAILVNLKPRNGCILAGPTIKPVFRLS